MTVSEAQTLSKESRAALRKALTAQLQTVRKKVRQLRAKNLAGEKEAEGEEVSQDVNSKLADGKVDRSAGEDRRENSGRDSPPIAEKVEAGGESGKAGGSALKAEAEEFFSKGTRPKTGKTKSFFAQVMTSEHRSFSAQSKAKKSGGGRRK